MLELINSIEDLKKMSKEQLPQLCEEIRQQLIDTVTVTGGHLSSNLGVVELTVALHYIFDEQCDIVWDVGHQSYVHKILTGRREELNTIRQCGGISGFTDPSESKYDSVISGHASTSISSAIGIATANKINNVDSNVVAVIGDGALTGGLTHEALNNIRDNRMLVVINDNNMSIDNNIGAISTAVSKLRVGKYYTRKKKIKKAVLAIPLLGKPIYRMLKAVKRSLKFSFVRATYFDHYGIKYIGIVDGHDIKGLLYYLENIKKNIKEPTILHILTQKGKGYLPAEENATKYHNISTISEDTTSSNIVGDTLLDVFSENDNAVAITSAMASGVGIDVVRDKYPDRVFDVGIAEGHAVTFAGGLATKGIKPYVGIYSTFLQRAYDNIVHDVCIANLPVTFLIDRAGLVGQDGKTHQGTLDISYLSSIPNMTVWCPYTYNQLREMIKLSVDFQSPLAIRYSKTLSCEDVPFDNKWTISSQTNSDIKLLCVGRRMTKLAREVATSIRCDVVSITTIKPLDNGYLSSLNGADKLFVLEEGVECGSVASQLSLALPNNNVYSMSIGEKYIPHGTVDEQLEMCHFTKENIINWIKKYS